MTLVAGAADKLQTLKRTLSGKAGNRGEIYHMVGVKDPLIGQLLASRFQLIEMIGQGAMAIVYKAKQTAVDRYVAVKVMRPELASDPVQQKRFQREARSLSKLDHPNLLKIFDIGQTPSGRPYFIMEYLKGRSIEKMLEEAGPVQPLFALKMFVQVCDAMDHAHKQGIIHRDLKPENIMLIRGDDEQHLTKVVDFGIVKYTDDQMASQKLTKTGEVWGSPVYMSPEQCKGERLDPRSDIYSLGLVMYEALTGEMTFDATKIAAIIVKQIFEAPKPFKDVRPDLNLEPKLEAVVFKCLEKEPGKRFQSMAEVRSALKPILEAEQKRTGSGSGNLTTVQAGDRTVKTTLTRADTQPNTSQLGTVSPSRTTSQQAAGGGVSNNLIPFLVVGAVLLTFILCATALGGVFLWKSMEDAKLREQSQGGGTRHGGSGYTGPDRGSYEQSTTGGFPGSGSQTQDTKTTDGTTLSTTTTSTAAPQSTTTGGGSGGRRPHHRRHSSGSGSGTPAPRPQRSELDYLEDFRAQPP
jgi:serine/threonine protein kinase